MQLTSLANKLEMQNKNKIGIAIAGLGFGESVHIPALSTNNLLKPVALWHPRESRLKQASTQHDLPGFKDWNRLLENQNIEAIILATPPGPRFELAKQALNARKHLLLEKPVALKTEQIEELQKLSIQNNLSVAVDFEYRAVPLFMQAKRILSQQTLGKIWMVKLDWVMSSRANFDRQWNWYSDKEQGGGVIGALGTHAFDLLHWLFGPTYSVNGLVSTSIKERKSGEHKTIKTVTSEDICLAQLELESEETNRKIPTQVTLSSVSLKGRGCWLEVYGSDGTLILGSDNQQDYVHGFGLWLAERNSPMKSISADKDLIFAKTWKDGRIAPVGRIQKWWGESIRDEKPIIPGLCEAVQSQKVCDKIKESAKTGIKLIPTV